MHFLKKLHLPYFFQKRKKLKTFEKEISLVLITHMIIGIVGAVILGIMPVILESIWQSKQMAGIIIMILTGIQVFIFMPLAGNYIDKYGPLKSLKLGIIFEFIGALILGLTTSGIGIYIFFIGVMLRWAFYMSAAFVLSRVPKSEGGFWFGIREELIAIANFIGLIFLGYFLTGSNWIIIPILMVLVDIIGLFILQKIKKEEIKQKKSKFSFKKFISIFNFGETIRSGLNYVFLNHKYPLFNIGTNLFEGLFYGSIWFLFPLHLASKIGVDGLGTLHLEIYEIITILFAVAFGFISDRFDWKKLEYIAWIITLWAVWLLPFLNTYEALIFVGFIIGLTNNLFAASGYHVLALFHKDTKENGRYMSSANIIKNMGYMISPAICGYLYEYYGFSTALTFVSVSVSFVAIWMIYLTFKLKR